MLLAPETSRYVIGKERNTETAEILARLQGGGPAVDDEVVFQRRQIETSLEIESLGEPFRVVELLRGGKIQSFRRMCLCCAVSLM